MGLPRKKKNYISPEEFLEIRRNSPDDLEYIDGEIVARAGTSRAHGLITVAIAKLVDIALGSASCVASSGISVAVQRSFLIPDLVVYCDGGDFTTEDDLLRNPVAVFEVLSDSTEGYDHGPKWMRYQQIPSLMHYVMISQDLPLVEVYSREAEGEWHYRVATGFDGVLSLSHLGFSITCRTSTIVSSLSRKADRRH